MPLAQVECEKILDTTTSTRCPSAGSLTPSRPLSYRRGKSVQTTGPTSDPTFGNKLLEQFRGANGEAVVMCSDAPSFRRTAHMPSQPIPEVEIPARIIL
jgi:hypothetical protein